MTVHRIEGNLQAGRIYCKYTLNDLQPIFFAQGQDARISADNTRYMQLMGEVAKSGCIRMYAIDMIDIDIDDHFSHISLVQQRPEIKQAAMPYQNSSYLRGIQRSC